MLLIVSFPRIFPRFEFFYEQNSLLATLELTQSHVNSCILSRILHTEGKVQIGNNQSRSPLWNIILFSCSVYLPSHEIATYIFC